MFNHTSIFSVPINISLVRIIVFSTNFRCPHSGYCQDRNFYSPSWMVEFARQTRSHLHVPSWMCPTYDPMALASSRVNYTGRPAVSDSESALVQRCRVLAPSPKCHSARRYANDVHAIGTRDRPDSPIEYNIATSRSNSLVSLCSPWRTVWL